MKKPIQGHDGKMYDLYNLPENFTCKFIDFQGIDINEIKFPKYFYCEIGFFFGAKIPADFDLSLFGKADIRYHDFANGGFSKWPQRELVAFRAKNVPSILDLIDLESANFDYTDLSKTTFVGYPKKHLSMQQCILEKTIIASGLYELDISHSDASNTKFHSMPYGKLIAHGTRGLENKILNFENTPNLEMSNTSIKGSKIPHWPSNSIYMRNVTGFAGLADFRNVKQCTIFNCDIENADHILTPTFGIPDIRFIAFKQNKRQIIGKTAEKTK